MTIPYFVFFKGGGVNISKKSLLYISLVFSMVIIFSANVGFATDNLTDNTTNSLSETDILSQNETGVAEKPALSNNTYKSSSSNAGLENIAALWVWSTSYNSINPVALKKAGYTDIFVFTKHSNEGISQLNQFIKKFKGSGIRVHSWVSCFVNVNGKWIAAHDTTRQQSVRVFIHNIITTCPGVNGIHLDYVRYGGTAHKYGVTFSTNTINKFVSSVKNLVNSKNPNLLLSAAVMPECSVNEYYYGQSYAGLSPYLNFMTPMIYKGNYHKNTAWIGSTTKWIVEHSNTVIVTGLQAYRSDSKPTPLSPAELEGDAKIALSNGSKGFAMFRYGLLVSSFTPKKLFIPTPAAGSPARGAVNVPVDKIITTKFTEPIFPGNMLIELKNSAGKVIPITISISGNVLTMSPVNPLVRATTYKIIFHQGCLVDSELNPVAYYTRSFTTDNTPPKPVKGSPARNAVNVPINKIITTTFNEPIKPGTMNIQLKTNTGTNIPTTNTINGNTLTITPNNPLKRATKYTIILYAGSITDLAGNPITKYSRPFTTDNTPPKPVKGSPARNAVNVPINKIITTTFNEPIKPGTMNIQLKTNTGTNIPTTNTINGNTLTITPNNPLKRATKYTIILYAGSITDLAGNPITKYSRPFTTAAV